MATTSTDPAAARTSEREKNGSWEIRNTKTIPGDRQTRAPGCTRGATGGAWRLTALADRPGAAGACRTLQARTRLGHPQFCFGIKNNYEVPKEHVVFSFLGAEMQCYFYFEENIGGGGCLSVGPPRMLPSPGEKRGQQGAGVSLSGGLLRGSPCLVVGDPIKVEDWGILPAAT